MGNSTTGPFCSLTPTDFNLKENTRLPLRFHIYMDRQMMDRLGISRETITETDWDRLRQRDRETDLQTSVQSTLFFLILFTLPEMPSLLTPMCSQASYHSNPGVRTSGDEMYQFWNKIKFQHFFINFIISLIKFLPLSVLYVKTDATTASYPWSGPLHNSLSSMLTPPQDYPSHHGQWSLCYHICHPQLHSGGAHKGITG